MADCNVQGFIQGHPRSRSRAPAPKLTDILLETPLEHLRKQVSCKRGFILMGNKYLHWNPSLVDTNGIYLTFCSVQQGVLLTCTMYVSQALLICVETNRLNFFQSRPRKVSFTLSLWLLVRQEAFDLRGADRKQPGLAALTLTWTLLVSHYLTVVDLTEYELPARPIALLLIYILTQGCLLTLYQPLTHIRVIGW